MEKFIKTINRSNQPTTSKIKIKQNAASKNIPTVSMRLDDDVAIRAILEYARNTNDIDTAVSLFELVAESIGLDNPYKKHDLLISKINVFDIEYQENYVYEVIGIATMLVSKDTNSIEYYYIKTHNKPDTVAIISLENMNKYFKSPEATYISKPMRAKNAKKVLVKNEFLKCILYHVLKNTPYCKSTIYLNIVELFKMIDGIESEIGDTIGIPQINYNDLITFKNETKTLIARIDAFEMVLMPHANRASLLRGLEFSACINKECIAQSTIERYAKKHLLGNCM